jgi:hypothetical protein
VVLAHGGALRACYDAERARDASLRGEITAGWVIAPDGSVTETSLRHSTMKAPRVEGCVLHEIASWHFVATPEGIHVLSFPFTFEPESRP